MENYRQSVIIETTPVRGFEALTKRIPEWWGQVDNQIKKEGDSFRVSFGEAFWTFKVTKFEPGKEIIWLCTESNQVHAGLKGVKEEWLGTILHWRIQERENNLVEIDFLHEGLVPSFNCYEVCSTAWDFFITDSLKQFLEQGKGKPEN